MSRLAPSSGRPFPLQISHIALRLFVPASWLLVFASCSPSAGIRPPRGLAGVQCDVLVVGGSLGGVAAALAAAREGRSVVLLEETDWLGGQATSQGVSAPDEHGYIETFGGTAAYAAYRNGIRDYYLTRFRLSAKGRAAKHFNPGNAWVSRIAHEPRAGLASIETLLHPWVRKGVLRIFPKMRAAWIDVRDARVMTVGAEGADGSSLVIQPGFLLDATDTGECFPLAGVEYRVGAESKAETGELHAAAAADPKRVQSFTYPFAIERRPKGERHVIPRPAGYASFRSSQPYTLHHFYEGKGWSQYRMFGPRDDGKDLPFWTYRRLIDRENFDDPAFPNDIAMINWPGNDYRGASILDVSPNDRERILDQARRLSLGFLYWLQTECPRDDGGKGYPEFRPRPDVMGTVDALSMRPYIREGRRLAARKTIVEPEISAAQQKGARAAFFPDSVGIGLYGIDLHACAGDPDGLQGIFLQANPFQIPLGAMVPVRMKNVLPAGKNLGVTHVTNGACRLHPVEWNTGESAGALAAFCAARNVVPADVLDDAGLRQDYQAALVRRGIPLYWYIDVPVGHPAFEAVQLLAAWNVWPGSEKDLLFHPDDPIDASEAAERIRRAIEKGFTVEGLTSLPEPESRAGFAMRLHSALK